MGLIRVSESPPDSPLRCASTAKQCRGKHGMVRWALALVALVVLGIAGQCHSEVREWEVGPESLVRAPDNLEGESCPAAGGCVFFLTAGSGFVRTNASTTHFRANADTTAEWDAVTLEEDNRRLEGEFFNVISTGPSSYSIAAANPALNPRTVLLDVVGPWRTPSLATTADVRYSPKAESPSRTVTARGLRLCPKTRTHSCGSGSHAPAAAASTRALAFESN